MYNKFDSNYDSLISFKTNGVSFDNVMIEKLSQKYIMSDVNLDDKKSFLKLKKEYYRVKGICDYETIQEKLYDNKSKSEILSFELSRILKQNANNPDILEYVASIQSILSSYKGEIPDELYIDVANIIIFLEISLGMKIGLFKELNLIFENKLHEIALMDSNEIKRK